MSANFGSNYYYEMNAAWTPQYTSIISYWKMDGDLTDSIGTNNGTVTNVTYTTSAEVGSAAAVFNGSSSLVTMGTQTNLAFKLTTAFSIAGWVYFASTPATQQGLVVDFNTVSDHGYALSITASAAFQFFVGSGVTNWSMCTSASASPGWHHLAAVWDGTNATLYVDTVAVTPTNMGTVATINNTQPFYLGGSATTGLFQGTLDDFAIWTSAFTANDVKTIYTHQKH